MKKYFYLIVTLAGLIFSQSCYYDDFNSVSGDGNVVTESRKVGDFHGIDAAAGLNVYVTFGEMRNEISVEADENLHEYIITVVEGGVLKIKTKRNIRNAKSKSIYVNAGEIDILEASSASRIIGENELITGDIKIDVSSAANIEVEMKAEKIKLEVSSSGDARLHGSAERLDANISSAGGLKAFNLEVRYCNINISSAGDADIFVTQELNADASSAGHITYKGNPEITKIDKSSAGSVSKQ